MRDNHSAAEKIKEISGTNPLKCMKCGKCSATCPSFDEMDIKPHQFVSYVINENIEALVNSAFCLCGALSARRKTRKDH